MTEAQDKVNRREKKKWKNVGMRDEVNNLGMVESEGKYGGGG